MPRLEVNISADTVAALTEPVTDEGISYTEAVRLLVLAGTELYRADKEGADILIRTPRTFWFDRYEQLILLD